MTELKPEERARQWIDRKLEESGWQVINRDEYVPGMSAVAVREAAMKGRLEADYLLLLNGKAAAVLEAKREEISLDNPNLIAQAENYTRRVHDWCPAWQRPLPFVYLSNGKAIAVKDCREPDAEYQIVKKFHRPWDLKRALNLGEFDGLPYLSPEGLRTCVRESVLGIEASFKQGKRRALLNLATGSGKTWIACLLTYRYLAYTPAKRVLFLVDRNNLKDKTVREYSQFNLTESGNAISDIFSVKELTNRPLDPRTRIVVSTIQGLYSQLSGKHDAYSAEDEDAGLGHKEGDVVELPENPNLPSDFFDLIIIDECHRSIYSDWQKVLTYFKTARLVGLTATPIPETLAFFDNNVVYNYSFEQSVLDGVNVDARIYRIKTTLTEEGGEIAVGDTLSVTSRKDQKTYDQKAIVDRNFQKTQLNREYIVRDQIRKVLQEYKDIVYTRLYPDREPNFDYLPKTLIFAVSELNARMIVEVAKEVFGRTDDKFVQRITYSVENSNQLISSFENDVDFRIAVTVTLVATGTDVKPLECLIFFNDVHSEVLYKQMKGRGCRTIENSKLRAVTPNALSKDLFYVIDAVGVTESEKYIPALDDENKKPLNPSLEILLEKMSHNYLPDDYFQLLASKLSCIARRTDPEELQDFAEVSPVSPHDWAARIMKVLEEGKLPPFMSVDDDNTERMDVIRDLITNVKARRKLIEIAKGYVKEIVNKEDEIISSGFSFEEAHASTSAFEEYVNSHRDEIEALRLIYNNELGKLSRKVIEDLTRRLEEGIPGFHMGRLWSDYALLQPEKVKSNKGQQKAVTDLIQLVRFAYKMIDSLYSLTSYSAQRFELWYGQAQRSLSDDQKALFREIASYVAQNGACDFNFFWKVQPDYATSMLRIFGSRDAANHELFTLNEFILKAA